MDYESRKRKYLDKLRKASSHAGRRTFVGVSDTPNDDSLCFNDSHRQHIESNVPNDLLAQVERYIKANPMCHITKNRLTVKRGLNQKDFQSNNQNRNYFNSGYKSRTVRNIENIISYTKSNQTFVNDKPDTFIKGNSPNATSPIKYQQTLDLKNNNILTIKNKKCGVGENIYFDDSVSDCSGPSKIIKRETPRYLSTPPNKELNKNKFIAIDIEEKAKLNLTYCTYLEFVHSYCDEIKSINEKVYPKNDYCKNLKKCLQQVKLKYQNMQNVNYDSNLTSSSGSKFNDKLIDTNYFKTIAPKSISSCSNFTFKPVISLSYSPDKNVSLSSQDSFVCSSQETLFTDMGNLMKIRQVGLESSEKYSYFSEICSSKNNNSQRQRKIIHSESISSDVISLDSSLEKSIQKSNNNQESSSENSEDSFRYNKKKMF